MSEQKEVFLEKRYPFSGPKPLIQVDLNKRPWEQDVPLHNRWHPEIPDLATVRDGEFFRVECLDALGGQIKNDDFIEDVLECDLAEAHYLSGPFRVEDKDGNPAQPGDLIKVEICNLGPLPGDEWGYTCTLEGGGFLQDHFPGSRKVIWDIEGIWASSRHIDGIRFPGIPHCGVIGTAPSRELLATWNAREEEVLSNLDNFTTSQVLHSRPAALLPDQTKALLGKVKTGSAEWERIAKEAARTIPPRENGGNVDIKNLSRGTAVYLPVFVEGGKLSVGDMHFSEGDGEIALCGAIEMSGFLELKCTIIRGGMKKYNVKHNPFFEIGPVEPRFSEYLVFEGISVDEDGRQHFLDASLAYKRAVLNAIDYLSTFGYAREQLYLMLSCVPCEGRISGIVDVPNACATFAVPTAVFDQDVRPIIEKPNGPKLIIKPRGKVVTEANKRPNL